MKILFTLLLAFSLRIMSMDKPIIPGVTLEGLRTCPKGHKFSPDGNRLLVHADEVEAPDLRIFETTTGKLLARIATANPEGYKWSPQGTFVAVRQDDVVHVYTQEGTLRCKIDIPLWYHIKFSNNEQQIYCGQKESSSRIAVFATTLGNNNLGKLPIEGRLGSIDPLDERIAVFGSGNTIFFSTTDFKELAKVPGWVTGYSFDGQLCAAHVYTNNADVKLALYNRASECLATFDSRSLRAIFATINDSKTILSGSYYKSEAHFAIQDPAQPPLVLNRSQYDAKMFSSWDSTSLITLKEEVQLNDDVFKGYDYFTRVYVADRADEKLDPAKSVLLPGCFGRICYTRDPDVILVGTAHILNLKNCQVISPEYASSKGMQLRRRKIKDLISKMGAYLDVARSNGKASVCIIPLEWKKGVTK